MRTINKGEKWPDDRNRIARRVFGLYANSPSRNFVQVDWHPTDYPVERAEAWPKFEGDDDTRLLWPKGWRSAGIVAVRHSVMEQLQSGGLKARPAVATMSLGDQVWASMLPYEHGNMLQDGVLYNTVAGRIGPGVLRIMPAFIVPSTSELLIPRVDEVQTHGPVSFMPALEGKYSHTAVV